MKSYTNIEQSQKLAEILPLKSADMEYILEQWIDEKTHRHKEGYYEIPVVKVDDDCPLQPITHPCWSLAALLNVLPKNLDIGRPVLATNYRGYYWVSYFDEYMKEKFTSKIYNNPIDACYEMILKLHEQNLL